ncbi:MAG TPA: hypothetical protein VF680_07290 [Allosphingosinicella sp.]|jgi:hypothetical protein
MVLVPAGEAVAQKGRALPPAYKWGRCLLQVEGRIFISGACAYSIGSGGSFDIQGPHQIYSGIDYPEPEASVGQRSTDYFAHVNVEGDSGEGFWNADVTATHAHGHLGTLSRRGACWVNALAKVCLWRQ